MLSTWTAFVVILIFFPGKVFVISIGWNTRRTPKKNLNEAADVDQTREASRLLREVENAFLQGNCGQPSMAGNSKILQMLEKSVFSSELAPSKLLAAVLEDPDTSRRFIEILTNEIFHSQDSLAFVVIFIERKSGALPDFVKIFNNFTKLSYTDEKEVRETTGILKQKLRNYCDGRTHVNDVSSKTFWTNPFSNCFGQVFLETFHVVYACNGSEDIGVKAYIESSLDLKKTDINQCDDGDPWNPFAKTNMCPEHSICRPTKNYGFRDGGYTCICRDSKNGKVFNGSLILKDESYMNMCEGCKEGDTFCSNFFALPDAVVVISLIIHIAIMIAMFLPGFLVAKLRKTKTLSFNFWQLYEVMLVGGLLIYLSVIIDYLNVSLVTCIMGPWLREIGFVVLYSSMMLKIHRMRVECRSRQAQRVLLRDKDLIRHLAVILLLITWQLLSWTVINLEHMVDDKAAVKEREAKGLCEVGAWHHVIEIEEFVALVCFVYLCCSVSAPPSFAIECRTLTFSLVNEGIFSALHNSLKHFMLPYLTQQGNFLMSVIRCHLTVSVNLVLLMSIKLWQARTSSHVASSCRRKDGSTATEGIKASTHRPVKSSKKPQEAKDSNDMNLSGLNPEDVKAELRRLYKQLEMYKAKSSRKDISHNTKKQTTRKQGPRRFSLYNFHHARHSKHHVTLTDKNRCLDDCTEKDHSRITPEESTNSCEVWNLMSTLP